MTKKILIGSDHAGFKLKEELKKFLKKKKILYEDLGAYSENYDDDYPDYAFKVGEKVIKEKTSLGILICGTGTGMVVAANKIKGIRAALIYDEYSAKMAKTDNNINVACLRGRKTNFNKAKKIVSIWLATKFSNIARHKKRIKKILDYERRR